MGCNHCKKCKKDLAPPAHSYILLGKGFTTFAWILAAHRKALAVNR